jgi:hypothetical protein
METGRDAVTNLGWLGLMTLVICSVMVLGLGIVYIVQGEGGDGMSRIWTAVIGLAAAAAIYGGRHDDAT